MNLFLSKPSVYSLPGTWEKQPMIQHFNLTPDQGFILFFGLVVLGLVGWGLYLTFGPGKKDLKDQIDEHSKMHELGIAHGHKGNRAYVSSVKKDYPKHNHGDEK